MRVAILRCRNLPSFITWEIPDADALFEDDRQIIRAFEEQGCEASSIVWSDPGVDWNRFDVAILRTTWDYIDESAHFLDVLSRIDRSSCTLFNPLEAVRWNSDKSYLFDLESRRVPTIPTYRASRIDPTELQNTFAGNGWHSAILKPTIGAAGSNSYRAASGDIARELSRLAVQHPHHDYLIQPFIDSVATEGEWSFVYFNRELSHVLLKTPAPGDYRVQTIYGGTVAPAAPERSDLLQADAVMAKLPFDLLYTRLDMVRVDGRLAVMEVELIEPVLHFDLAPGGIGRLVNATMAMFAASR